MPDTENILLIGENLQPADVLVGYLLDATGLMEDPDVVLTRHSPDLIISDEQNTNFFPQTIELEHLRHAVADTPGSKGLDVALKLLGRYRHYPRGHWGEAVEQINQTGSEAERALNYRIAQSLLGHTKFPYRAYASALRGTREVLENRRKFIVPEQVLMAEEGIQVEDIPIYLPVPLELGQIINRTFNLGRIAEIVGMHENFTVGGSQNRGKSTLSVSLVEALKYFTDLAVQAGLIKEGAVVSRTCDIDAFSPTTNEVWMHSRDHLKLPGSEDEVAIRANALTSETRRNTITIGDLPGGIPDEVTDVLLLRGHRAILISDRSDNDELTSWVERFSRPDFPPLWATVESSLEGRSMLRSANGFDVVIAGLNKKPIRDPIIDLMACKILLESLPDLAANKRSYINYLKRIRP